MVAQLAQRPSRVERQRIDRRVENYDSDRRKISESYKKINLDNSNLTQKDVYNFFKQAKKIIGDDFKKRKQPAIPYLAIYLALVKDLLDYAELTGVGYFITLPISIISSAGLIYWAWGKTSFRAWKEKFIRWLIISTVVEILPVVSLIPSTVILVLLIHHNETKIIRLINLTLDYSARGGMLD